MPCRTSSPPDSQSHGSNSACRLFTPFASGWARGTLCPLGCSVLECDEVEKFRSANKGFVACRLFRLDTADVLQTDRNLLRFSSSAPFGKRRIDANPETGGKEYERYRATRN